MQHRFTNAPSYGLDFSNSLDPWKDMKQLWTEAAADKIAPVTGPSTRTLYVTPFASNAIFASLPLFNAPHLPNLIRYLNGLHQRDPITTGTSVLAIQYKDGVMLTADTLGTLLAALNPPLILRNVATDVSVKSSVLPLTLAQSCHSVVRFACSIPIVLAHQEGGRVHHSGCFGRVL